VAHLCCPLGFVCRIGLCATYKSCDSANLPAPLRSSGNCLRSLPSSLGALSQLLELEVSGNDLEGIPESLYRLEALKKLSLNGNRLTGLPIGIQVWKAARV
jgi:hypothetical protein